MAYDPSYLEFVLEQLGGGLSGLNHRPMFGGVGIYAQGIFFALIAEDTLYFYTDETNRAEYEALGMGSFGRRYREVPIGVLEDGETLRAWAEQSLRAAQNKPGKAGQGGRNPAKRSKTPDK